MGYNRRVAHEQRDLWTFTHGFVLYKAHLVATEQKASISYCQTETTTRERPTFKWSYDDEKQKAPYLREEQDRVVIWWRKAESPLPTRGTRSSGHTTAKSRKPPPTRGTRSSGHTTTKSRKPPTYERNDIEWSYDDERWRAPCLLRRDRVVDGWTSQCTADQPSSMQREQHWKWQLLSVPAPCTYVTGLFWFCFHRC